MPTGPVGDPNAPIVKHFCFAPYPHHGKPKHLQVLGVPSAPNWLIHQGPEITREQIFVPVRKIVRGISHVCGVSWSDFGMEAEEADVVEGELAIFELGPDFIEDAIVTFAFYWWIAPYLVKYFSGPFQIQIPPGDPGAAAAECELRQPEFIARNAESPMGWSHVDYDSANMTGGTSVGSGLITPYRGKFTGFAKYGICGEQDGVTATMQWYSEPGHVPHGESMTKSLAPGECDDLALGVTIQDCPAFSLVDAWVYCSPGIWPAGVTNNSYIWGVMGGCTLPVKAPKTKKPKVQKSPSAHPPRKPKNTSPRQHPPKVHAPHAPRKPFAPKTKAPKKIHVRKPWRKKYLHLPRPPKKPRQHRNRIRVALPRPPKTPVSKRRKKRRL